MSDFLLVIDPSAFNGNLVLILHSLIDLFPDQVSLTHQEGFGTLMLMNGRLSLVHPLAAPLRCEVPQGLSGNRVS